MRAREDFYQHGSGGGDAGEEMLIYRKQAQILGLKRFDESRHGHL